MTKEEIHPEEYQFETAVPNDFRFEPDITPASIPNTIRVEYKVLPHGKDLPVPKAMTSASVGVDLYAAIDKPVLLSTIGKYAVIPCGFCIQLPRYYEAQIRPRSGLAAKNGITVLNSPGTIDSDYQGEIMVILVNLSTSKFTVERGMRIAQMVLNGPIYPPHFVTVDEFGSTTERGTGGFGSTGTGT